MPYAAHMPPKVVAVEQFKGGVMKTSTAVALADAAGEAGAEVLLVDTDPQGQASRWFQLAEATGRPLRCTVAGVASRALPERLPLMSTPYAFVVIDGPPLDEHLVGAGMKVADLIIMPIPPKRGDMDRVAPSLNLARSLGKPVLAVQTFTQPGTVRAVEAREALEAAGVDVAQTTVPLSNVIADMYGTRPRGRLAAYGRDLLAEVLDRLGAPAGAA
jgi:chromosome partitioning protein